ncbi:MAG: hypothetical protein GXO43_06970 [Crenarchaeota archaeon]|nr:hypothetical protein [Thermoproteota archaeon]
MKPTALFLSRSQAEAINKLSEILYHLVLDLPPVPNQAYTQWIREIRLEVHEAKQWLDNIEAKLQALEELSKHIPPEGDTNEEPEK